jgi:UDP-glucose 6-dehydrogenase
MKNSPATHVIACLDSRATIRAYDPLVPAGAVLPGASVVASAEEAASGADCLVIMNDSEEFAAAVPQAVGRIMRRPLVIDCAAVLDRGAGRYGIRYLRMGQGEPPSARP